VGWDWVVVVIFYWLCFKGVSMCNKCDEDVDPIEELEDEELLELLNKDNVVLH
jgi:hypothetical protein